MLYFISITRLFLTQDPAWWGKVLGRDEETTGVARAAPHQLVPCAKHLISTCRASIPCPSFSVAAERYI